ncbi:hypothetical protein BV898_18268 [Hypsibius exemplaris]|uniref:Uncharacterized protein n=1 Tax=Hypsibius exemplaris TaxID=2072580 RepID=A0A9X6NGX1_HYPEX|nr:hypothetical protein BV898_18268 [Hypsibius exemplaris]
MTASISVKVATRTFQATDQPSKMMMLITVQDTSIPDAVYDVSGSLNVANYYIYELFVPFDCAWLDYNREIACCAYLVVLFPPREDIVKAALKRFRRAFTPTLGVSGKSSSSGFTDTATNNGTKVDVKEMGDSSKISTHCLFFTNCSYSCKTNCDSKGMPLKKAFPSNPNMRYTEYNCTDVALFNGVAQWRETDGVVKKFFDLSQTNEIVASCVFYETNWYECYGVADCSRGDRGILTCEGSAPWRGFYDRSPLQGAGWSRNVTQEAMNNGGTFQGQTVAGDLNILRTCN